MKGSRGVRKKRVIAFANKNVAYRGIPEGGARNQLYTGVNRK